MGLGVPDPGGIFGTTKGLVEKFGPERVLDMPCAENGMTGIAIGSSLTGMRPIMTHQRMDFALLAMEQIVNQAAKWYFMFGGKVSVPIVIRIIIGRGWGQGPQHSQCLHSWFAHVPGLKVILPATPKNAKGLTIAAVRDNNPVVIFEHRWLHYITGEVPTESYEIEIGKAIVSRTGTDITIVALSYMVLESIKASDLMEKEGVSIEVIDLCSIRPLDTTTVLKSVKKTGRLIVADIGALVSGISSEIISICIENIFSDLKCAPVRIGLPDFPTPTSPSLSKDYYPHSGHIEEAIRKMMGLNSKPNSLILPDDIEHDKPNPEFKGPF
tara:strand:+ start:428 stop:1405 length:978 start_codon:yes stop_codon:yes gene_type:complete